MDKLQMDQGPKGLKMKIYTIIGIPLESRCKERLYN